MNMYGAAGLGAGLTQGVETATKGAVDAEQIKQNRELMRQQAEYRNMQIQQMQQQQTTTELTNEQLAMQVSQLRGQIAKKDAYDNFSAYTQSGDVRYLNLALQNPEIAKLAPNTARLDPVDPNSDLVKTSGINPELIAKDPSRYVRAIGKDGSESVVDMYGVYGLTGYLSQMRKEDLEKIQLSTAQTTQQLGEAKLTEAQNENILMKRYMDQNPNATIADLKRAMAKPITEEKPSDVKSAEYFGKLEAKPNRTPEEEATLQAWYMSKGGTEAAKNVKVSKDTVRLKEELGIDLNSPNFDINNYQGQDRAKAEAAIRDLSNTASGKKLEANIAKKLGEGVGSVQATADKLSKLVTEGGVSTNAVKEVTNQVKSYLPEELRDMTDEDLKDAKFRQAYLASAAVFLKLQSGLTVSEKEAERFAQSFGTLSKNTKVNMIGLQTKLNEVIADYEANKAIEPTLYNAKYASSIKGMKNISSTIDKYVAGESATPTTATPTPSAGPDFRIVQDAKGVRYKQYRDGKLEVLGAQ